MGGVAVLHPQDCLKDPHHHHHNRHGFFSTTPVKSRRSSSSSSSSKPTVNYSSSSPNLTRSEGRKRSPPTGVRKNNNRTTAAVVSSDPPPPAAMAVAKNLVMGQVKILKRGEPLDNNESTVLKDIISTVTASAGGDRKVGVRKVLPAKKKPEKEKEKRSFSKVEALKVDDFALSSTDRLGPDPEMVPKQMKKNIAEFFFAGSAFVDSPPPSSLPLPGFFTKKDDPSTDLRRMLGLSLS